MVCPRMRMGEPWRGRSKTGGDIGRACQASLQHLGK
jgi:hypothetical protein